MSQPVLGESPSSPARRPRNRPWLARSDGPDRIYLYLASLSSQSLGQAVQRLLGERARDWTVTFVKMRADREVWLLERDQT